MNVYQDNKLGGEKKEREVRVQMLWENEKLRNQITFFQKRKK